MYESIGIYREWLAADREQEIDEQGRMNNNTWTPKGEGSICQKETDCIEVEGGGNEVEIHS
jgi:hypothetical protein